MRIDESVEEIVREAYRAVIGKDGDRLVGAFRSGSEDQARSAVAYGVFVAGYVINDVLRERVTDTQLLELAENIIESEADWVDLGDPVDLAKMLASATRGDLSFEGVVPREDVIGNIFVSGGYLLTSYRNDDQHWWDYLNEIWAALEATPEPA
jgi:hypothetical protein